MNGRCPSCERTFNVRIRRGDQITNHACPTCQVPLRGITAGTSRGRYLCPIEDVVVTLGQTGWQLDQPYRLAFQPGPGVFGRPYRQEPDRHEQDGLDRVAGRVLGTGAVVDARLDPYRYDDGTEEHRAEMRGLAGLDLQPADDPGEPGEWLVNEPLTYRTCVACGGRAPDLPANRPEVPWTPRRQRVLRGRGRAARHLDEVAQGPHPAGSLACPDCNPHRGL